MIHDYAYAGDEEDEGPDRDTWCTPQGLAKALGEWDLDPCSNERSHINALRRFDLNGNPPQDGLVLARYVSRSSRVFVNPPYSRGNVIRFVQAYRHTRFCFLVRLDASTEWFSLLYASSELMCIPRDRVNFEPPPGIEPHHKLSNPFPHALMFARACDATESILRMCYVSPTTR